MLDFPLLRLLAGYLRFRASGGFAARFLNLCETMRLRVWNLRQEGGGLTGLVSPRDYRKLHLAARRAGMRLCCLEKRGLPFFLKRRRRRWGLLAGAVLCAVLAVWSAGFLWSVETTGAQAAPVQDILAAAARIGLASGRRKPKTSGEDLAVALQRELDGALSWAAVNIIGSRVMIEVRDAQTQETLPDPPFGEPCDLVADFDGLLLSLEVHSGVRANKAGNGVKKGDLLISGTRLDREGKPHSYEARGKVTALHEDLRTLSAPEQAALDQVCAVRRVRVLRLWHLALPLGVFPRGGTYSAFSSTRTAVLHGVLLPFSVETRTRLYWAPRQTAALPLVFDTFVAACDDAYRNTNVLSGTVAVSRQNGSYTLTQRSRVIDYMGVQRPLKQSGD